MAKIKSWIVKAADQVERFVDRERPDLETLICASGISPSGVIHLGNLREIFTVHLVVEELKDRGRKVEHLHFWDDYDRLRKIPGNVPAEFEQHIGKPLSEVPDPYGELNSYADRFSLQFEEHLKTLGVYPTYIRQSEIYKAGTYTPAIKEMMEKRLSIFDILLQFIQEEKREEVRKTRDDYYPFKVYCESCGTDATVIDRYDPETATIYYHCENCGHEGSFCLNDKVTGKLVWKVDWPMRWRHYSVAFEPGGVDHSTPGSSFSVGKELVRDVMNSWPPQYIGYAFVGMTGGSAKISSSAGSGATPDNALRILEPALLRWLYIRTDARKSFNINFDQQIMRLYDEWDTMVKQIEAGKASATQEYVFRRCTKTHDREVAYSKTQLPFRLLSSAIEMTADNANEVLRIVSQTSGTEYTAESLAEEAGLRMEMARNWGADFQSEEEKLRINSEFDASTYAELSDEIRDAIGQLRGELEANWSLDALSTLLYGIPKRMLGVDPTAKPTPELKALQRELFKGVYRLIVADETGPRLPTLFISLGQERVKELLGGNSGS